MLRAVSRVIVAMLAVGVAVSSCGHSTECWGPCGSCVATPPCPDGCHPASITQADGTLTLYCSNQSATDFDGGSDADELNAGDASVIGQSDTSTEATDASNDDAFSTSDAADADADGCVCSMAYGPCGALNPCGCCNVSRLTCGPGYCLFAP